MFLGMFDASIGETQVSLIFSALNIGNISHSLIKCYERLVGKATEAVALDSCTKALETVIALSHEANDVVEDKWVRQFFFFLI